MFSAPGNANLETAHQTTSLVSTPISWFVLRSKPQKEGALSDQLLARGLKVFYPSLHVRPVNPRSRTLRPLFPGYLFVHINLGQTRSSKLHWTPFSLGLVAFDGVPVQVSETIIRGIKSQVEKINAAGVELFNGLQRGDVLTIQAGSFAGYEAIFDVRLPGNERVRVLLKLLEQKRLLPLELPAGHVRRKHRD